MGEKNALCKIFPLRFSLINRQHVDVLRHIEEEMKKGKKSRNQCVIDALSDYFALREQMDKKQAEGGILTMGMLDDRIDKMKTDIRTELYQEFMKFFAGNLMGAATVRTVEVQTVAQEIPKENQSVEEANDFNIEEDDVIMSNVKKWS